MQIVVILNSNIYVIYALCNFIIPMVYSKILQTHSLYYK